MREARIGLVLSVLGALAFGCGDPPAAKSDDGNKDTPPGAEKGFDTNPGSVPAGACNAAAKLVYVLSVGGDLYSFAPDKLAFSHIGHVDCPSGTPSSMAVDRNATAWVSFTNGKLAKVDTTTAKCTETTFVPGQQGVDRFGMAFSTNGGDSAEETLYVSGVHADVDDKGGPIYPGKGLGKIDLTSMQLTLVGDYSAGLAAEPAELTGTGDGRLFGFFVTPPHATLAVIDHAQAATSDEKSLTTVDTSLWKQDGTAFAFSFWGGDFWLYTTSGDSPSSVTKLDTKTNQLTVVMPDAGIRIVGAGVSTCAPITQPK